MFTSPLIIIFMFIAVGTSNTEVIKSETITPRSSETNGIKLLTNILEVSKQDKQDWSVSISYQNTWQFIFILDETWNFTPETESSLSFTVNAPETAMQTFDNIILAFSTHNYEYISMLIPIGNINNNQINSNRIYPNCFTNIKSEFGIGDIASMPYFNRQCDVANYNCENWQHMIPFNLQTFNTFPITVTFVNNPKTNTMHLSLQSLTSTVQTCDFPATQGLKIYFGGNGNGQRFDISSFKFVYSIGSTSTQPTATPTTNPTSSPTKLPTSNPIFNPTVTPTDVPTSNPVVKPSINPTVNPSSIPTLKPTFNPSLRPTLNPTDNPIHNPTTNPSLKPTFNPLSTPTRNPIFNPTTNPTLKPTVNPTLKPTFNPTLRPTFNPTLNPTRKPTINPSSNPTFNPTSKPTFNPIRKPTFNPSWHPTFSPSSNPSYKPTFNPSTNPTSNPTVIVPPEWRDIYYDNMETNNGWFVYNQVSFDHSSSNCPNALSGKCVRINGCSEKKSRGGDSYIEKIIDIAGYQFIKLKIDVTVYDMEPQNQCEVYYAFGPNTETKIATFSIDGIYIDHIVDLPYPTDNSLVIKLKTVGDSVKKTCTDVCYYNNLYIQGLVSLQ